jgi:hypothetical protein
VSSAGQRDREVMATNDDFLPDIDADAERFVDDDELDLPTEIAHPTEGSIADVIDQHRVVPTADEE